MSPTNDVWWNVTYNRGFVKRLLRMMFCEMSPTNDVLWSFTWRMTSSETSPTNDIWSPTNEWRSVKRRLVKGVSTDESLNEILNFSNLCMRTCCTSSSRRCRWGRCLATTPSRRSAPGSESRRHSWRCKSSSQTKGSNLKVKSPSFARLLIKRSITKRANHLNFPQKTIHEYSNEKLS